MSTTPASTRVALRTLLRSIGQIVLQANAWTGVCVLAALTLCEPRLACAALLGAVAANLGALLAGCDERDQQDGLYGFNGALAALAAAVFIDDFEHALAVALLAATVTGWCQPALARRLRARSLACYSGPCLLVSWCWLAVMQPAPGVATASTASAALVSHSAWSLATITTGVLAGLAQTTFASGAWAGALVLAGLAMSSRRQALYGLLGAAIASALQAAVFGVGAASFEAGLAGFNGALVALALANTGALAAFAGVLLAVAFQQWTGYYHWPAMTAPFVLASWCVQGAVRWSGASAARRATTTRGPVIESHRQDEPLAARSPPPRNAPRA